MQLNNNNNKTTSATQQHNANLPISNSNASIRELTPTELTSLQSENEELRNALQQMAMKIEAASPQTQSQRNNMMETAEGQPHAAASSSPNATTASGTTRPIDWSRVKAFMINDTSDAAAAAAASSTTAPRKTSEPDATVSGPMIRQSDNNIIISNTTESGDSATGDDQAEEKQVSVLEVSQSDWWTIVNPTEQDDALHSRQKKASEEADGFVVVTSQDACDALADYISASVLQRHPEAARVSPEQLRKLLDSTLSTLRQPTRIGTVWQWGKSAYTTYGWIAYAYGLYREPAMIGLAATTAVKVAGYLLVMVL